MSQYFAKKALVTGAAHRVGQAIAMQLARQGYDIAVHCHRSLAQAQKTAKFIRGFGVRAIVFQQDLSKVVGTRSLARATWKRLGPIDVLVNSAAIFYQTRLGTVQEKHWDRLIDTNLKSLFFLSQDVGMRMKRRGRGQIINILDVGAFRAWAGYLPYCTSKAGAAMLTQGLAKALAPRVRVNAVAPGPVMHPPRSTPAERKASVRASLLKRMGKPEDVARTVGFLADGPDYMTGAVIAVDGGRMVS